MVERNEGELLDGDEEEQEEQEIADDEWEDEGDEEAEEDFGAFPAADESPGLRPSQAAAAARAAPSLRGDGRVYAVASSWLGSARRFPRSRGF